MGEGALGPKAQSHPESVVVDAASVGRRSRALPWEICMFAFGKLGRKVQRWMCRSQQRAYEVAAAAKGPNKPTRIDTEISMRQSDADKKAEMRKRNVKPTTGSPRCNVSSRPTSTANEEHVGSSTEALMEQVLQRDNLFQALKRVRSNKGGPGIDGMTVDELPDFLRQEWARIREQLLSGAYIPQPVRIVEIPKPDGGMRTLGIPTVLDRLIQQAILQVLSSVFEPHFSDASFGFRPGRSAQQAVIHARDHVASGYRFVVDLDLEKFFDRVNHDIVMSRVARRVKDKRLLRLIRSFLTAGMMSGGVLSPRVSGTPQGGPLSPLLSNIMLDDFDKELEKRGHRFVRYADDAQIYVRSRKAGERVLRSATEFLEKKLRLRVNRDKSAVGRPWERSFLGYSMTNNKKPRLKVAPRSMKRFRERVRDMMRWARGRNIQYAIEQLSRFVRGWFGYFRLVQVKAGFERLDQWIRHHIRKLMWIRWKKPKTRWRKLRELGISAAEARTATATGRGPWWSSRQGAMQGALPKRLLERWGLVSLQQMQRIAVRKA